MEVEKKFIFTDEGRNLLISQDGGVRFAAIGGILVQGLAPVPADMLWETYRGLTFEQLLDNDNVMIGMPDVAYKSINTGLIEPVNEEQYEAALEDIKSGTGLQHMFGTYYKPNRELEGDSGSHYGTYEFTYDKTSLAWDMQNDVSFSMLILIGKQYAETDDATFNVDKTQSPVIVGIAQLPGIYDDEIGPSSFEGGIEFLAEQNKYICTSLRLQFTLTDADHDATEIFIDEEKYEDYMDMMSKMSVINDGLKTKDEVHIVDTNQPKETLEKLDDALSNTDTLLRVAPSPGSVATQRTMMIADPYYATDLENQWNAGAQVHIVNKKVDKDNKTMYKEQIVLTTLEAPEDIEDLTAEELTAYYAGIMLRGKGAEINGETSKGAGPEYIPTSGTSGTSATYIDIHYNGFESPIFRQVAVPEYDKYAVDIFGIENKILDTDNIDKFLFSQRNVSFKPAGPEEYGYEDDTVNYGYNVVLNSHENIMNANTNNMFVRSNGNILSGYSNCNLLFASDRNLFTNGANTNLVFGSDLNMFDGENSQGNIIIGGSENFIDGTVHSIYFGGTGLKSFGLDEKILMGNFNAYSTADVVYGCGTSNDDRRNALEFFPSTGTLNLYNNGSLAITLGGANGILMPQGKVLSVDKLHASDFLWTSNLKVSPEVDSAGYITMSVARQQNGTLTPYMAMRTSNLNNKSGYFEFSTAKTAIELGFDDASDEETTIEFRSYLDTGMAGFVRNYYSRMPSINGIGINSRYNNTTNKMEEQAGTIDIYEGNRNSNARFTLNARGMTFAESEVERVTLTPEGLEFFDENHNSVLKLTEDTQIYQKLTMDVTINIYGDPDCGDAHNEPVTRGWRPIITSIDGPEFYKKWIKNIFKGAAPICMMDGDHAPKYENKALSVVGSTTAGAWNSQQIHYLSKNNAANVITFASIVAGQGNFFGYRKNESSYVADTSDSAVMFYAIKVPTDPNGRMINEIEINLYLEDYSGYDYSFPAVFYVDAGQGDFTEMVRPLIKLNVSLHDSGDGNDNGEDFWIWTYNHNDPSAQQDNRDYNLYRHVKYKEELKEYTIHEDKITRFTSRAAVCSTGVWPAKWNNNPAGWIINEQ